jgi:hypothetical protein
METSSFRIWFWSPLKIGGIRGVDIWAIQLQCLCNQSNLQHSPATCTYSKHISYNYSVYYPQSFTLSSCQSVQPQQTWIWEWYICDILYSY